jgi:hypothetical protein
MFNSVMDGSHSPVHRPVELIPQLAVKKKFSKEAMERLAMSK